MPDYNVLTLCDACGEFKFCRMTDCDDDICAFCADCDTEAGGDAAAAIEAKFEDTYTNLSIEWRRAFDLSPDKDEEQILDAKPELF